jgi:S1-C subfamily serine protease
VVGINTLVRSGPGAGLGFAIPINRARTVANQLVATGRASHPMIGVGLDLARNAGSGSTPAAGGALVASVLPNGPAAQAGLRPGDLIVAAGGRVVKDPAQVISAVESTGVGRPLSLTVQRNGSTLKLDVVPGEMGRSMPR